jgi:hypothetical protein
MLQRIGGGLQNQPAACSFYPNFTNAILSCASCHGMPQSLLNSNVYKRSITRQRLCI